MRFSPLFFSSCTALPPPTYRLQQQLTPHSAHNFDSKLCFLFRGGVRLSAGNEIGGADVMEPTGELPAFVAFTVAVERVQESVPGS